MQGLSPLVVVLVFGGAVAAQAPCGDCNDDSVVNVLDALEAAREAVGLITLDAEGLRRCDVDRQGAVDVRDALLIGQFAAGIPIWLDCAAEVPHELCLYSTGFTGGPGYPWPAGWSPAGGVDLADLQAGGGRLRPVISTYSLARMAMAGTETDVEVTFTFSFEDPSQQGVGFYVRQNGGYLTGTMPAGQGYAVFVEGFRGTDGIGIWKEEAGVESELQVFFSPGLGLAPGVRFRVRLRVTQDSPGATRLRCRMWAEGSQEPGIWHVDVMDATPALQGTAGGFAVDAWSSLQPPAMGPAAAVTVDDIKIVRVVDPLAGIGSPTLVGSGYTFLEGPHWRTATSELYFCDVSTSRIYALTPPSAITLHRTGTGAASGLATDVNGDLLAVEWSGHRLSREDGMGVVSTVVSQYLGSTFNSPNDLTVRSDGTIYFTDPPFGGAPPGPPIGFNGLFRYTPGGTLIAEWMGGGSTRPNGVILSPDEQELLATDWAAGTVLAWDVAVDGSLSGMRQFASGLPSADGLAVDIAGNLYVARSGGVSVLSPWGDVWGFVSVPGGASNCAFGGTDARTLYVTAGGNLYALSMVVPGHF